ncbi:MAG TPA: maleylacetoacetate isomerase [Candidatus Sulfotelmatobacter sp.]|nr:maleylacetoacetate isomerase [Candidatus Sulfotelmatobacter sp.]
MKLYGHWRSLATLRVRIALNLKGIATEDAYVDLSKGEQLTDAYRKINPEMMLPTLVDGDGPPLFQSLAIIEYLDETHPTPPLLPKEPRARARVRGLAMIHAADSHPLLVPRVRNFFEREFKLDEAQRLKWIHMVLTKGFEALEANLTHDPGTGKFCQGDQPTIADICLVAHSIGAGYFNVDTAPYPTARRIVDACMAIDAFARAHPLKQPDAPKGGAH